LNRAFPRFASFTHNSHDALNPHGGKLKIAT